MNDVLSELIVMMEECNFMELRILFTSLNLRVEKEFGKTNLDYVLSDAIARHQLKFKDKYKRINDIDIFCNVEYMECKDEKYLSEFSNANYKRVTALFGNDNRGILCYFKKCYRVDIIKKIENPHFLHFKLIMKDNIIDIIVFRILVSNGQQEDFDDRLKQWEKVMKYIDDNFKDKSKLILIGDWNHAKIRAQYIQGKHFQYVFNYQKIKTDLENRGLKMGIDIGPQHTEHSYKGYLAIDHIAVGGTVSYAYQPYYSKYNKDAPIGEPDHAFLFADINIQ